MGTRLSCDPAFCETTFMVIDFEATTPPGARPEPIDVAAMWLTAADGTPRPIGRRFQALIKPPAHAPVTDMDTRQTAITAEMVARQPSAHDVLAKPRRSALNRRIPAQGFPAAAGIAVRHLPRRIQLAAPADAVRYR